MERVRHDILLAGRSEGREFVDTSLMEFAAAFFLDPNPTEDSYRVEERLVLSFIWTDTSRCPQECTQENLGFPHQDSGGLGLSSEDCNPRQQPLDIIRNLYTK